MNVSIEEFYQNVMLNPFFDESYYIQTYPEVTDFFQPYCKDNNISEKKRLYFHWNLYGIDQGQLPCEKNINRLAAFTFAEVNTPSKLRLFKMLFNFIKSDTFDPHVCVSDKEKQFNINLVEYISHNIELEDRIEVFDFDD